MNEAERRRNFQRIKALSTEKFWETMNWLHTRAYVLAEKHYQEAMDILLTPKQKAAVVAKALQIREDWDGLSTFTVDDTTKVELESLEVR